MFHDLYHCQQLSQGIIVILLCQCQIFAEESNDPLSFILYLQQHETYSTAASIHVKNVWVAWIGVAQYKCQKQVLLDFLKGCLLLLVLNPLFFFPCQRMKRLCCDSGARDILPVISYRAEEALKLSESPGFDHSWTALILSGSVATSSAITIWPM